MKITEVINALTLLLSEHGDLEAELLETVNGNTLPKNSYTISVASIDGNKFVDISDVWDGDDE